MTNKKKTLDITLHTHAIRKCKFIIGKSKKVNGQTDWITFAYVWLSITACLSELDDNVHMKMNFELDWNNMESPNLQEQSETIWMFNNLTKVIGFDMKELIDTNICSRINDALPTSVKIFRKD